MRAQGALEYLIIIAAVLGITAVVVVFLTGAFSGSSAGADLSKCRLAAANCQRDLTLGLGTSCTYCEEACTDSAGLDLISGTLGCNEACLQCKSGSVVSEGELPGISLNGQWDLDDGRGVSIYDSSETGNNGVYYGESMNNGVLTNGPLWADGKYGKALSLDGINDYVSMGAPTNLNFNGANSMTVAAWIYPQNVSNTHVIYGRHTDCLTAQGTFRIDGGGRLKYIMTTTVNGCSGSGSIAVIPVNTWTHVAFSWNGTAIVFYINGAKDSEYPLSGTITVTSATNAYIGSIAGVSEYFNGTIDSVRVWKRGLNQSEIQSEMASSISVIRPVAAWELDEGAGIIANDTHIWVAGRSGAALSFDGLNDYISIANSPTLTATSAATLSAWVRLNSLPPNFSSWAGIAGKGQSFALVVDTYADSTKGITFAINATAGYFARAPGEAYSGIGVWKHIIGMYNGTMLSIYVNGVLKGTQFHPYGLPLNLNNFEIGKVSGWTFINGTVEDVRFYNRTLTPAEMASLYAS